MGQIHTLCPAPGTTGDIFSRLTARITPHLDRAGVSFTVTQTPPAHTASLFLIADGQDPEETARRIIKADRKEFLPVTTGEYLDEAVRLGLLPSGTDWKAPVTMEDAAVLTVRLLHLIRP